MKPLTIPIPLESLTPEMLAEAFWAMDSNQQAKFFGHLGACALATPAPFTKELGSWSAFNWQMYHAGVYPATPLAAEAMRRIGDAADKLMSDQLRQAVAALN